MDGAWGSIQADWRVLLLLVLLWYILLRMWERNGTLDKWNASRVFGFVLMVRAKYGLKALEKVPRKLSFSSNSCKGYPFDVAIVFLVFIFPSNTSILLSGVFSMSV